MGQPPDNLDGADTRATETPIAINMEIWRNNQKQECKIASWHLHSCWGLVVPNLPSISQSEK